MERKIVDIGDIVVPDKMKKVKPKLYKVMGMEAYKKKYGDYYGELIVDKNLNILDGYVIYYVARHKFKETKLPVRIVSMQDRIKHFFKKLKRKVGKQYAKISTK